MVFATFGLTIFSMVVFNVFLKNHLDGAPRLAAQYFFVTGGVKVLLAILLFAVFLPRCPSGCQCDGIQFPLPIYPIVCLLVGILWLSRGLAKLRIAQTVTPEGGAASDAESGIFKSAPDVEIA